MRNGSHTALSAFIVPIESTYRPDPEDPAIQDFVGYDKRPEDIADILELSAHDIVLRTGQQPDMTRLVECMHETIQFITSAQDKRKEQLKKQKATRGRR